MSIRLHAVSVILKLKLKETFVSYGYYVALTIGLGAALALVAAFVDAVDSSGFDYALQPLYNLVGQALAGALGATFVDKLFAAGPYLFALYICLLPVVGYIAFSSVFRFGHERQVGAIELLSYGPADGTSYALATFARDAVLTLLAVAVLAAFLALTAVFNNLALSIRFVSALGSLVGLCFVIYAYGMVAASVTNGSASAVGLLSVVLVAFLLLLGGSYTVVSEEVRNISGNVSWLLQWISPFYYWQLGHTATELGRSGLYWVSLAASFILAAGLLAASHGVLKLKGVRV